MTQLLDPVFAGDVVKFMALQAMWLRHLILNKDYNAFNAIPDHVVRNIGSWLIFVIHQVCNKAFANLYRSFLMNGLLHRFDKLAMLSTWPVERPANALIIINSHPFQIPD